MTAQMDNYKQESLSTADLIGQDWQKLLDMIEQRPGDDEVKSFDGGGSQKPYREDENILRTLQDVKRLRQKDMPLFGHCPETDVFYTVVCSECGMILLPHALRDHWEKRHIKTEKPTTALDKSSADSPNKIKSKKIPPIKTEKMDKLKKIKPISNLTPAPSPILTPVSSIELTDDLAKDPKRMEKLKKQKSVERTVPPELESALPNLTPGRSEKRKQKLVATPCTVTEMQPIVALSPIQMAEKAAEESEVKDLPKKTKKDKKKNERKADKVYDPNKHCGVINDNGKPCVRSILCKVHQVALKRAVPNRSMPYDMLTRILKTHNDEEKSKVENGLIRPKIEPMDISQDEIEPQMTTGIETAPISKTWTQSDQISIKTEEPPCKRLKIKEEKIAEEDGDQIQYLPLPSDIEALIEETLKDVEENEPLPVIPTIPKFEPLVKWNFDQPQLPPKGPTPPPPLILDEIHWHSSHPKPLATNTFGCRLIGGLMSTCKKLDTLRKHLQSVWASSSASSATPIRSGFNDLYGGSNPQNTNNANANPKTNFANTKYLKKPNQNKSTVVKKNVPSPLTKGTSAKRKRKANANLIAPVQNTTPNASDIISGLLIGNPVPIQRTGPATVPTIPTGVIPVNSITGNGVPLRLFQGSLPVIASTAPNQPATFIQLNLCPPK